MSSIVTNDKKISLTVSVSDIAQLVSAVNALNADISQNATNIASNDIDIAQIQSDLSDIRLSTGDVQDVVITLPLDGQFLIYNFALS